MFLTMAEEFRTYFTRALNWLLRKYGYRLTPMANPMAWVVERKIECNTIRGTRQRETFRP